MSNGGPGAKFDLVGDFSIIRGLPWTFRYERTQPPGRPIDLTGCAAEILLLSLSDPTAPAITYPATIVAAEGLTQFDLDEADTQAIPLGYGRYRIYTTNSLGVRSLYMRGRVAVLDEA